MFKKIFLTAIVAVSFAFAAGPCCKAADMNNTAACGPKNMTACPVGKKARGGMACGMQGNCCTPVCINGGALYCFKNAKLGLTKQQSAKLAEISKKYTAKMAETPKGCATMPIQFTKDGKFDKEAFLAKHNEATANMGKLKAEMFEEAYGVLDDKQKQN